MAEKKLVVMISSTARDLPEYREQVEDACLRVGMFPSGMEQLPALDADAIKASLDMVDKADVYVGVFAHRFGYVPEGHEISITQMEYEQAVERKISRLIFLMDDDVPVLPKDFDKDEAAVKLEKLKDRLKKERVANFFKNPDDLRAQVIHSLVEIQKTLEAEKVDEAGRPTPEALAASLHYISDIPEPPEPYIAHPYTLLQVRGLIGRQKELDWLTDWIAKPKRFGHARILNVVAIGGMGKSALTWTWFNKIAPQEMSPLAGRLWWSFYESDARFENFVTRALAYVSRQTIEQVKEDPLSERQSKLLAILDREPFLLVLDGLERILIAYARMDAAYLQDTDVFDKETENYVAGALGLPESAGQSFVGRHQLRKTADVRAGQFLRKLARVRASRILVSTRLYPADLQLPLGDPMPGCAAVFLPGLSDQDALDLWREYGAKGSREVMLPVFRTFDKHPLLIQTLASHVATFKTDPGNFDAWHEANPDFNPFDLPLVQVQSHVLAYSLRGLTPAERRTLYVIAGLRMAASMDTIKALLIREDEEDDLKKKPFATLGELDAALTALEDRGLLGWDKHANRYDLHPIVRGVVWRGLDDDVKADIYGTLQVHFEAMPTIDYDDVNSLEDLTPAIELYNALIELGRYDDAFAVWKNRLEKGTLYRLSANRQRIEMLERLFPTSLGELPQLSRTRDQSYTLNSLAAGYHLSGQPGAALLVLRRKNSLNKREGDQLNLTSGQLNLSHSLQLLGDLRAAEELVFTALIIIRDEGYRYQEEKCLSRLGIVLAARGVTDDATAVLQWAQRIFATYSDHQGEGVTNAYLAELALWTGDSITARLLADRAWKMAATNRVEADFIRAARLQGTAALYLGNFDTADERLHHALTRARAVNLVDEELPALVALAEWHLRRGEAERAREMLDDVWEPAERGPYPLFHADALNVLAQIERDAGHTDAAIAAATEAYEKAWCDGPPFAYHWGLEKAKAHLAALRAPEPEMPPFDASQHEPMPEVEINPPDEFGGEA